MTRIPILIRLLLQTPSRLELGALGSRTAKQKHNESTGSNETHSAQSARRPTTITFTQTSRGSVRDRPARTCHHSSPWRALNSKAWWLLCHPSPNTSKATAKLLRELSRVRYACSPHTCTALLTSQVMCIVTSTRITNAHTCAPKKTEHARAGSSRPRARAPTQRQGGCT